MAEVELGDFFADDEPQAAAAAAAAPVAARPYTGLVDDDGDYEQQLEAEARRAIEENEDVDAMDLSEAEEEPEPGAKRKKVSKKKKDKEGNDDATPEKEGEEGTAARKKKTLRPKNITLDAERLLESPYGLSKLKTLVGGLKFKKDKGAESHNLRMLMQAYEVWMDGLLPKVALDNVVERLEKIGHKQAVRAWLIDQRTEKADADYQAEIRRKAEEAIELEAGLFAAERPDDVELPRAEQTEQQSADIPATSAMDALRAARMAKFGGTSTDAVAAAGTSLELPREETVSSMQAEPELPGPEVEPELPGPELEPELPSAEIEPELPNPNSESESRGTKVERGLRGPEVQSELPGPDAEPSAAPATALAESSAATNQAGQLEDDAGDPVDILGQADADAAAEMEGDAELFGRGGDWENEENF